MTTDLTEILAKAKRIMAMYQEEHPEVKVDRDYYPFKVTEEWGECLQAYLMLTDRGRQKGLSKDEIRAELEKELGDVFGFLLLFADREGIDLSGAIHKKWLSRLPAK